MVIKVKLDINWVRLGFIHNCVITEASNGWMVVHWWAVDSLSTISNHKEENIQSNNSFWISDPSFIEGASQSFWILDMAWNSFNPKPEQRGSFRCMCPFWVTFLSFLTASLMRPSVFFFPTMACCFLPNPQILNFSSMVNSSLPAQHKTFVRLESLKFFQPNLES